MCIGVGLHLGVYVIVGRTYISLSASDCISQCMGFYILVLDLSKWIWIYILWTSENVAQ